MYSSSPQPLLVGGVPCGAYLLSLGAVFALASAAAVGVAFATDNWAHVAVDGAAVR